VELRRKVLDIYPKRELYFASFLCLRVDQKNNSALASIALIYNKMSKRARDGAGPVVFTITADLPTAVAYA
jgi:hypothetical protein